MKPRDGGYSLLELVVTIALLAAVGTGISALMVTGTRLYSAQSASVRLQSKAQILTAQLRGYYLEADGDLTLTDDMLTYTQGDVRNAIVYDREAGRLYLAEDVEDETALRGRMQTLPLLADGVQEFEITLPVSTENELPSEVMTAITLEDRGATYETVFVTALRNHMASEDEDAEDG